MECLKNWNCALECPWKVLEFLVPKRVWILYRTTEHCLFHEWIAWQITEKTKGVLIWAWGNSHRWGPLPWWGKQSIHTISLFFLDRIHIIGGEPCQGGLPGQPVQVTRFGWVFSMWKLRSGVTHLTGVIKSLDCSELFQGFHLQNC